MINQVNIIILTRKKTRKLQFLIKIKKNTDDQNKNYNQTPTDKKNKKIK